MIGEWLTAAELAEYQRYYAREPWGCGADDARAALIAYRVCAAMGVKAGFKDYLPQWGPRRVLSYEEGAAFFAAFAAAHNAKIGAA